MTPGMVPLLLLDIWEHAFYPDELLHAVLPPALEAFTAWSIAETEDPTVFHHARNRAFGDAAGSPDPWRGFAT